MKCPRCGKVAHRTKGAAHAARLSLIKAGGAPDLDVYKCGDAWHVGHNAAKFVKRIRASLNRGRSERARANKRR